MHSGQATHPRVRKVPYLHFESLGGGYAREACGRPSSSSEVEEEEEEEEVVEVEVEEDEEDEE